MTRMVRINRDRLWASLMELKQIGAYHDEATGLPGVRRLALTDADAEARRRCVDWMVQAGLTVRVDRIGNVYATRPGPGDADERRPVPHAYIECHIEQGPILADAGVDIGIVEGVQSISWQRLTVRGEAAHAGTTPIASRHDAGLVAASVVVEARRMCDSGDFGQLRATVGNFDLAATADDLGLPYVRTMSGAGHDAQEISAICPTAMVFVAGENGGISHTPREYSNPIACANGTDVLANAVLRLADLP
jgi:acetylornithine deacetylase/succinyl-diaminopimelate desuccinylase-like protein